jgi:hypothetical protein
MILRVVSGLAGLAMLSYGTYGLFIAIRNPSLRMYLAQGGADTVGIFGHDVRMRARLFVLLIYLFCMALTAGGLWLFSHALRGKGDHVG